MKLVFVKWKAFKQSAIVFFEVIFVSQIFAVQILIHTCQYIRMSWMW